MRMFASEGFLLFLFAAWAGTILVLSLHPHPPSVPSGFLSWDKFQHAAAFGVLTLLGGRAFVRRHRPWAGWLLAFAIAVLYGAVVEIAQGTLSAGRVAEWGDLLADTVGAAVVGTCGGFVSLVRSRTRA